MRVHVTLVASRVLPASSLTLQANSLYLIHAESSPAPERAAGRGCNTLLQYTAATRCCITRRHGPYTYGGACGTPMGCRALLRYMLLYRGGGRILTGGGLWDPDGATAAAQQRDQQELAIMAAFARLRHMHGLPAIPQYSMVPRPF